MVMLTADTLAVTQGSGYVFDVHKSTKVSLSRWHGCCLTTADHVMMSADPVIATAVAIPLPSPLAAALQQADADGSLERRHPALQANPRVGKARSARLAAKLQLLLHQVHPGAVPAAAAGRSRVAKKHKTKGHKAADSDSSEDAHQQQQRRAGEAELGVWMLMER